MSMNYVIKEIYSYFNRGLMQACMVLIIFLTFFNKIIDYSFGW